MLDYITKNYGLIKEISVTNFKLKYQGSLLGYLWSLIKPLALFGILYTIFAVVLKIGKGVPNYGVYLLTGIMFFQFWADATSQGLSSIVSKGALIRKVYFSRTVLVISATVTATITFILNLFVVMIFSLITGVKFSADILVLIPLIIEAYILVLGVSFFLSALYVKFRDLSHIWEIVNRILFYATPIIYPIILLPENLRKYAVLNPLAQIIQDSRYILATRETVTSYELLGTWVFLPYIIVILILILGVYVFRKSVSKFAEQV